MEHLSSFPRDGGATQPDWIRVVREKVEGLSYGVVQLVVHDGRVTQIERTEKLRLTQPEHD